MGVCLIWASLWYFDLLNILSKNARNMHKNAQNMAFQSIMQDRVMKINQSACKKLYSFAGKM